MFRQTDRLALAGQHAADGLADPVNGIGRQFAATVRVESVHRLHRSDIALGDEILNRQATAHIAVGDPHHEPEVDVDHALAGRAVTRSHALRKLILLFRRQQGDAGDLVEIHFHVGGFRFVHAAGVVDDMGLSRMAAVVRCIAPPAERLRQNRRVVS